MNNLKDIARSFFSPITSCIRYVPKTLELQTEEEQT